MEEQTAFCSACGAPQIRVSKAVEETPESLATPASDLPSLPETPFSPSAIVVTTGIAWKSFVRAAAPLAAVTGLLTVALPPLGLFVLLPANLIWAISRYRRHRPIALRSGQGARMGALMGVLSFCFFLACFFATLTLWRAQYCDVMVGRIKEIAAQNPDPQAQQMLQWFATPDGLIVFTAIGLGTILLIFLIIGMGSGALAIALGKARNRP